MSANQDPQFYEKGKDPRYLSYLLRLWRVRCEAGWAWRASLQDPTNGDVLGFPNKRSLYEYLELQTGDKNAESTNEEDKK